MADQFTDRTTRIPFHRGPQLSGTLKRKDVFSVQLLVSALLSLWGIVFFGVPAFWTLLSGLVGFIGGEFLLSNAIQRKARGFLWRESLAGGLLLGLLFPPGINPLIPIAAGVFGQVVIRWVFGGSGGMWIHPHLAGRAVALISWPLAFSKWLMPRGALSFFGTQPDVITGGTTLAQLSQVTLSGINHLSPLQILRQSGETHGIDGIVTSWLNRNLLNSLGVNMPEGYAGRFFGFQAGAIGEVSIILLLLCSLILIERRVIYARISAWYLFTFSLGIYIFAGIPVTGQLFQGDILFHLLNGGVLMVGFLFLPDLSSAPQTRFGQIVYAVLAGIFTLLFRLLGSSGAGAGLAALCAMVFVPVLDRHLVPRIFGTNTRRYL